MTFLEDKAIRDGRGLDTLERGLVYAALVLRASNTHPANTIPAGSRANKYQNSVRVAANFANLTASGLEPLLNLSLKIPYNSQEALRRGGVFIEHVKDFNNAPIAPLIKVEPAFRSALVLPPEPEWVLSLEKYAAWISNALIMGHTNLATLKAPPININFLEEDSDEPSVIISAVLKLDYAIYLSTNNLVAAVIQQVPVPAPMAQTVQLGSTYIAVGTP